MANKKVRTGPREFEPVNWTSGLDVSTQESIDMSSAASIVKAIASPLGQVATGTTIDSLIQSGDAQKEGYQWVHGPSLNPFVPHEDLDGVEFSNFDDEVLANPDTFPDNEFLLPGDHDGCTCDFMPLWMSATETE